MATVSKPFAWKVGRHRRLLVVAEKLKDGTLTGRQFFWFRCPACKKRHAFVTPDWDFDGNFESPTFSPRLVASDRCTLWVQDGVCTFSSQSTHLMVGKVVPLPLLDDGP